MKKNILIFLMSSLVALSCNKTKNDTPTDLPTSEKSDEQQSNESKSNTSFDPSALPEINKDIGVFPYYTVPDWLKTGGYSAERESDFDVFSFFTGTQFHTAEGRLSVVYFSSKADDQDWSEHKFMKTYGSHFESLGAKKIWEGDKQTSISIGEEIGKSKGDSYLYGSTTQGLQERQIIYGFKKNGHPIYVAVASNNAYGSIVVLESEDFVQTTGILEADQIKKDLLEKGKSVLYINFDVDKATLKNEGKQAVSEIAKALNADPTMKIAINGYTDNTGVEAHNLQLSKDRASTVLNELTSLGIEKSRLTSNGFGAANPISDENTEAGRAQNRRVELVKR